MDRERLRKHLEARLKDEIDRIEERVSAICAPKGARQRSLIARYGKLLLLSQRLLETLPVIESMIRQQDRDGFVAGPPASAAGAGSRPTLRRFS